MQILTILYVVAGMILLFGAAVFVHEWGHYWMARRCGMKVEAFSIGFGPKIFGWTRDGIEYAWRWIPAGGYVKLPQMITSEALEGEASKDLPPASPLSKILVAFAGPFMNLVFAFVIATFIYFVGLPMLVNPSIVGFVEPGSSEAEAGIRPGDKIVAVNGQAIQSWQDVQFAVITATSKEVSVVVEREGERQTHVLEAAVNPEVGYRMLRLYPKDHPQVMEVAEESAAAEAGLEAKDIIIAFAGVPIANREQFIELVQKRGGQATEIQIERGSEIVKMSVTPRPDPGSNLGRIGVVLGNSSTSVFEVKKPGPTPWAQVADVWNKTMATLNALFHPKQTGVGVKDLSGPVGILTILAHYVQTDYRLALSFLVLLNINLAVLNLLPIPVLDGGHIVMSVIEKIRRRPMSIRFVEYTTTAFALLLISFMLYVTFHDVGRFSQFRSLFKMETQIQSPAVQPPAE